VDVWLLFSLVQPFVDVLLQSYVHYLRHIEEPKYRASKKVSAKETDVKLFTESYIKDAEEKTRLVTEGENTTGCSV
jgi:hypothetical protein